MTEWDALIATAGKRGYLWHMFRMDWHGPEVVAGVYQWRDCADVVVLFDDQHAHARNEERVRTANQPTSTGFELATRKEA
ncbi:MAG: hypothetical protein GEV28_19850 [Actinophytocola sp.]|uniref:hypothetical protein n=1 Tax=Actinophytocola sp. TaxID=1872138 RepID=UPI00132BDAA5|nr:hypothetical protein [Actinophytocola sp.]MPZ82529.1 hypothetical protein [Actinophytocola sp.]